MNTKIKSLCLLLFLTLSFEGYCQSKANVEIEFLKQLNTILLNSKEYSWNYFPQEVDNVKIEKPFEINDGILCMTLIYQTGNLNTKITMFAPLAQIKSVVYDHYLVLHFDNENVIKQQFLPNSTIVDKTSKQNYFHIGTPVKDGRKEQAKLEKLLVKLLKFYKD